MAGEQRGVGNDGSAWRSRCFCDRYREWRRGFEDGRDEDRLEVIWLWQQLRFESLPERPHVFLLLAGTRTAAPLCHGLPDPADSLSDGPALTIENRCENPGYERTDDRRANVEVPTAVSLERDLGDQCRCYPS